ncbi:MAG: hypothetical protein HY290_06160 [Planctomycetia bacterium]|nr:hypothetical protein [Planctomycetia bacterium]
MDRRIKPSQARPRAAILWGLAFFALYQAGLYVAMELRPVLRDPEYGVKLDRLKARIAEKPGADPLIVMLGSSRVSFGFRCGDGDSGEADSPQQATVPAGGGSAARPLVYNFGASGFPPTGQLVYLRRLLADGIRPHLVVCEYWPTLVVADSRFNEGIDINRLRWLDIGRLASGVTRVRDFYRRWGRAQIVPWYYHRYLLFNHLAPSWLEPANQMDHQWRQMDDWGWVNQPMYESRGVDPQRLQGEMDVSRPVLEQFQLPATADRAFRDIIDTCRGNQIAVAIIITPAASPIRGLYRPEALARQTAYLKDLEVCCGATLIDASDWVPDEEFFEGCHLTHAGSSTFARRFHERVVQPMLAGERDLLAGSKSRFGPGPAASAISASPRAGEDLIRSR